MARILPNAGLAIVMSLLMLMSASAVYAQAQSIPGKNWEMINYNNSGGSYSPQNQITKDNVRYLETKWVFPFTQPDIASKVGKGFGSIAPTTIVDGVVYIAMSDRRIIAVDSSNGRFLWNNSYGANLDYAKLRVAFPWLSNPGTQVHALNYYPQFNWLIPSAIACNAYAVDPKTGKTVWTLTPEKMCGTTEEFGDPTKGVMGTLGNHGFYSAQANPPVFLGNVMFYPIGGGSGSGGRSFVTAFDMTDPQNPKRLYRNFIVPHANGEPNWAIDLCNAVSGNGWYFVYPKYLEGINHPARDKAPSYLSTNCKDVDPEVVKNDWMDLVPTSKTFMKRHTASTASPVWGHYPLDPETGIVYIGWGDTGPYPNSTNKYGPNVPGSGFTAFDVKTGKMVWWFEANPHDMWDYDCSLGGIIAKTSSGQKIYIKGCKNGIVYGLDAATGKPLWIFDAPTTNRASGINYGVDVNNNPKSKDACCRLTKEDMSKPWPNYPSKQPMDAVCYTYCLESDLGFDGKYLYVGTLMEPRRLTITNVVDFGNQGRADKQTQDPKYLDRFQTHIHAVDINTGKPVWEYGVEKAGFRGGILVTGGMVVAYPSDGSFHFLDAQTGKLIHKMSFGLPVNIMPTIAATKEGKMRIFGYIGGGGVDRFGDLIGTLTDGALISWGLPDKLPEPQVVIKEVIKEVPKEVIKEVPKEVVKTVTVETVSPISYAAIGIGVAMVVVGVVLSRRRKSS